MNVDAIIPALDEAESIGAVVSGVLKAGAREIIVVDNGSRDATARQAREAGARVISEPQRGYGRACQAGIRALADDCEAVAFLDADGSDDPRDLRALVAPIASGEAQLVVGTRPLGEVERGALSVQQRLGNAIACFWLRQRYGLCATDLGPFRVIERRALTDLDMRDCDYGWTVEMQIKAAKQGLRYREIPVRYRRRLGRSKISGTLRGMLGASCKILGLLAYYEVAGGGSEGHN